MFVCFHVCLHLVTCVGAWERQTDGRTDGRRVCEDKEKPTQESGGSLHSRLCRAPGAALFIKTANLTTRVSVCVCVCASKYVCVCVCTQEHVFMRAVCVCVSTFARLWLCMSACVRVKINKYAQLKASCYLAVRPEEVILWYTDNFGQNTGL